MQRSDIYRYEQRPCNREDSSSACGEISSGPRVTCLRESGFLIPIRFGRVGDHPVQGSGPRSISVWLASTFQSKGRVSAVRSPSTMRPITARPGTPACWEPVDAGESFGFAVGVGDPSGGS